MKLNLPPSKYILWIVLSLKNKALNVKFIVKIIKIKSIFIRSELNSLFEG